MPARARARRSPVRKLTSGGATVNYSLYSDSRPHHGVGQHDRDRYGRRHRQRLGAKLTVYGRIPAQTTPAPGNYADTITVTVTY